MKICPTCNQSYPEEFVFCGSDGTPLILGEGSADPLIGRVLMDQWEIFEHIGSGGFGTVYKARDRRGHVDAVKILNRAHFHPGDASEARLRFEREADLIKDLGDDSAHIVGLRAYSEDEGDGLVYFVMEYVDGETLKEILVQEGALDVDRVIRICEQLANALAVAHRNGVVHRDLKLSNLMLTLDRGGHEILKVLDFGIAKVMDTDRRPGFGTTYLSPGTPGYAAPEQLRAGSTIDGRTDLYAVGIVLYSLLTGEELPVGESVMGRTSKGREFLIYEHEGQIEPLLKWKKSIPSGLERIILKLLRRRPEDRIQSAEDLLYAVHQVRLDPSFRLPWKIVGLAAGATATILVLTLAVAALKVSHIGSSDLTERPDGIASISITTQGFSGKLRRAFFPDRRFSVSLDTNARNQVFLGLQSVGVTVETFRLRSDLLSRASEARRESRWGELEGLVTSLSLIDPDNELIPAHASQVASWLGGLARDSAGSSTGIENLIRRCESLPGDNVSHCAHISGERAP